MQDLSHSVLPNFHFRQESDWQNNTNSDAHHVDSDQARTTNFTDDGHVEVDRGQGTSFVEDSLPPADMHDTDEPTPVYSCSDSSSDSNSTVSSLLSGFVGFFLGFLSRCSLDAGFISFGFRTTNFTDDGHVEVDRGQGTSFVEDSLPPADMNDTDEPTPVSNDDITVEAVGQDTEEHSGSSSGL
jgi:hypothetical protein